MVERFQNFVSAPFFLTNILFREFRSWYDVQVTSSWKLRWGGGAPIMCLWQFGEPVEWERWGNARACSQALPKTVVWNKHRRRHKKLERLYHFADSCKKTQFFIQLQIQSRAVYRPVTVMACHVTVRDRRKFAANGHAQWEQVLCRTAWLGADLKLQQSTSKLVKFPYFPELIGDIKLLIIRRVADWYEC